MGMASYSFPYMGHGTLPSSKNKMSYSAQNIYPRPQKCNASTSLFPIPSQFPFFVEEPKFRSLEPSFLKRGFSAESTPEKAILRIRREKLSQRESYRIRITSSEIILSGNETVGIFRGLQTLCQIIGDPEIKDTIPCLEIEDFPDIEKRGFMLDVSRCKVPTMESVFSLIDLLTELRINEFQLYIEHTFAFSKHKEVWEHASPFTANEIQEIDRYCKDRFIELIPNLNSFGHFERWLCHETYKHLAECPNGFTRKEPFMVRKHGTTLKPNQASLDLIDSLYSEYLPNFSSDKFNVGMDEPWELGQGWSREKIKKLGKDKIYLDHLNSIRKLVESHGKEMQFWADVLLENPENAKLLPSSASPVIWGYEPDHPFAEQAQAISSCGLQYSLAPGTGTWRSFSGRWSNTQANIDSAISNAQKYHAQGVLLTSWGDCGNHQPWATLYPPLFYGLAKLWNNQKISETDLILAMDQKLFQGKEKTPSSLLLELGNLDKVMGSNIHNSSLAWSILFDPQPDKISSLIKEKHTLDQFKDGLDLLSSIRESATNKVHDQSIQLVKDEISLGVELSTIALKKGIQILEGKKWTPLHMDDPIFSFYKKLWLARARTGGLSESIDLLTHATTKP
jgi:hexosaminidase